MNKLNKLFKAIGRIARHPYLLNLVLQDESSNKEACNFFTPVC